MDINEIKLTRAEIKRVPQFWKQIAVNYRSFQRHARKEQTPGIFCLWVLVFKATGSGDESYLKLAEEECKEVDKPLLKQIVGCAYLALGRGELATAYLREAVALEPNLQNYMGLRECLKHPEDDEEKIPIQRKIIELAPLDQQANLNLAFVAMCKEDYNQAEKYIETLKKYYPGEKGTLCAMAYYQYYKENYKQALKLFKKLYHRDKNKQHRDAILEKMVCCCLELNDKKKAGKYINIFNRMFPGRPDMAELVADFEKEKEKRNIILPLQGGGKW